MPPVVELVAGARPNFMKLAPVFRALTARSAVSCRIVHTGQHYDPSMDRVFFEELAIPTPDVHLGVGSGSHGAQTARILERYEAHLLEARPDTTVVFGDVNSTLACALAAVKLGVGIVHVEAGLRSLDRTMPEEINRLVTDAVSDLLLVSEPSGLANLCHEGIPETKIRLVGNVMIDTLLRYLPVARERHTAEKLGLVDKGYGLLTLHRPSNVDDPTTLGRLLDLFDDLSQRLPLVFPVHPRTAAAVSRAGFQERIAPGRARLLCLAPTTYLDTLSLSAGAALVMTDSGGLQEEAAALRIPCLTLRESTERPVTVKQGTSRLVGNDSHRIRAAFDDALAARWPPGGDIPLWDGRAGERVAAEIETWLSQHLRS